MVSRTREKLIDVARQLFAHKGVEKTTMNDIASASDKGRRTIYTYFKSKREIFNAVVTREANIITERLAQLPDTPLQPEEKLMNFIFTRFDAVKEVLSRSGSLHTNFLPDTRRIERVRRACRPQETEILKKILQEGIDSGKFRAMQVDKTTEFLLMILQGLDLHYIRGNFFNIGIDKEELHKYLTNFVMNGIRAQHDTETQR